MWRSIMHDDSRSAVGLALFCEHDAKSGVRQWRKRRRKMAVHVDGLGSTPRPSRQHRVCYDGRIARPASSPPLPPLRSLRLSVTAVTTTHHRHHHYPACKSLQSPPPACHLPRDVRCRAVDRLCQEEVVAAHVAGGGEAQAADEARTAGDRECVLGVYVWEGGGDGGGSLGRRCRVSLNAGRVRDVLWKHFHV